VREREIARKRERDEEKRERPCQETHRLTRYDSVVRERGAERQKTEREMRKGERSLVKKASLSFYHLSSSLSFSHLSFSLVVKTRYECLV